MRPKLTVLELYSGIGGMHWALKECGVDHDVVMAVDINTTANMIYKHNFPFTNLQSFSLEKLTLKKLESLNINTILLSPPCQPFTRVGKKGDCEDVRTKSFLHVLHLLEEMKVKPQYLLVENVKGFEISEARKKLVNCLERCGYAYQEFLLTPLQFGIPNCRLRYYLIANRGNHFTFNVQPQILTHLPKFERSPPVAGTDNSEVTSQNKTTQIASTKKVNLSPRHCSNTVSETHGGEHIEQMPLESDSCSVMSSCSVNLSPRHCSNTVSETHCGEHIEQLPLESDSCSVMSSQEPLTRCSDPCLFESGHLNSHTGPSSSSARTLEVSQDTIDAAKNNSFELKGAGRNMRYCEDDDDVINANSQPLSEFMEHLSVDELADYWLTDKELRLFVIMDIVFPALKKSTCFTKRYGHYVDGAGSVVQMSSNVEDVRAASEFKSCVVKLKNRSEWGAAELNILRKLQLRYFTPREVANLLCFPPELDFPPGLSTIQKYRVLGNSLNVHIVAELIKLMTHEVTT